LREAHHVTVDFDPLWRSRDLTGPPPMDTIEFQQQGMLFWIAGKIVDQHNLMAEAIIDQIP
jgi:hypothetical protein